jgi:H+/Cl- antiporter ClcA
MDEGTDGTGTLSEAQAAPPVDPGTLIRSSAYRRLLVFAAVIGVVVSLASRAFLELIHWTQSGRTRIRRPQACEGVLVWVVSLMAGAS